MVGGIAEAVGIKDNHVVFSEASLRLGIASFVCLQEGTDTPEEGNREDNARIFAANKDVT